MDASSEQEKMLRALNSALEMELDGQECYLAASRNSTNEAGAQLFDSLAKEEAIHHRKFEELFDSISKRLGWLDVNPVMTSAHNVWETVMEKCHKLGVSVSSTQNELEAVQIAIDKEKNSYDFYEKQASNATYDTEREFYLMLAKEEREHELALLNYYEYFSDPAGWFLKTERQSLDG
jgi:rubrerythrin